MLTFILISSVVCIVVSVIAYIIFCPNKTESNDRKGVVLDRTNDPT